MRNQYSIKRFVLLIALVNAIIVSTSQFSNGQTLPYTFKNNTSFADDEIYIAMVGIINGGNVWINCKTSSVNQMSLSDNTVQGPIYSGNKGPGGNALYANCFTKLSDIPNKTIAIPQIAGCRILISFKSQLYLYFFGFSGGYAAPDLANTTDPSKGIRYEMIELTWGTNGLWSNTTRVDSYQYPMGLEVWGNSNYYMKVGELKNNADIIAEWKANVPAEFQGCLGSDSVIKFPTKTAAFLSGGANVNYLVPYINSIWTKYSTVDLVFGAGTEGVWRGRVNGNQFNFTRPADGATAVITRQPTNQEAMEGSGVMATGTTLDKVIQAQVCAAITRHAIDLTVAGGVQQDWSDDSKYYQTPLYNWYCKFWHQPDITYNKLSYTFCYDDVYNKSSTINCPSPTKALITIGGFANTIPQPPPVEEPYNASRLVIPGVIEAEEYDKGGEGLGYHDSNTGNTGGKFRQDDVDIETSSDLGGGYDVGWINTGEWLNYSVTVKETGSYSFIFRTASLNGGGAVHIAMDGTTIGSTTIASTGGWQVWANAVLKNIALTAGDHILTLYIDAGGFNCNSIAVVKEMPSSTNSGYLHASGKNIINNNGNYIIRAVNLGNWMIQEPYMMQMTGFAGTQHEIKTFIEGLIGIDKTQQFYNAWLSNSVQKSDIDSLAAWGFNTIRLPMHYNLFTLPIEQEPDTAKQTWLEKGFALTDSVIAWCTAHSMYVILDLHATPGGQGRNASISDYDTTKPSLWQSQQNKNKTIALWKMLAARYAHNPWVGGFDLINETNWSFSSNNTGWDETLNIPLKNLMVDLSSAIRQVDNNHILYIEGNSFANNYSGLSPVWDNNMAYSFHKYWNSNDESSLNFIFYMRDTYNVPIWLGETGENSNFWFTKCRELAESNNIGWSFWPLKKLGSINSPFSVKVSAGYQSILDYGNGKGQKPNSDLAFAALMDLTEKVKTQNLGYNKDVTDALFRQFGNTQTKPYANLTVPGTINAIDYDMGLQGYSYNDNDFQDTNGGSWNDGWAGRNDGVDLQWSTTEQAYTMGWTNPGEWVSYTCNTIQAGQYQFRIRYASISTDTVDLTLDGKTICTFIVPPTGGWDTWQNAAYSATVAVAAGSHLLKIVFRNGNINIRSIQSVPGITTQTISLQKGWNLISTNVTPTDSSIASIFAGLDVEEIKTMDAFWRKGQNSYFNSLKTITTAQGYLIYMNSATTLSIIGTPIVIRNSQFIIDSSWQLIGCPYQSSTPLSSLFDASTVSIIKNFDGFWMPTGTINSIQNLDSGKAYFIRK